MSKHRGSQPSSTHEEAVGALTKEGNTGTATYDQVVKSLAVLSAAYPSFPTLGEHNFLAYYQFLQDIPPEVLAEAVVRIGSTWTWSSTCPGAGVIRQKALEVLAEKEGLDTPAQAWGMFLRTAQRYGEGGVPIPDSESSVVREHHPVQFSNPVLEATVQAMGGYRHLVGEEHGAPTRKHFMDIYEGLLAKFQEKRTVEGLLPIANQLAGQVPLPALEQPS